MTTQLEYETLMWEPALAKIAMADDKFEEMYEEMSLVGKFVMIISGIVIVLCYVMAWALYFMLWATILGAGAVMIVWVWYEAFMWVLALF